VAGKSYAIGYCKPPTASQFQKGKSGNPKGRPKASPTVAELMAKESEKVVTVSQNGKAVKMSKQKLLINTILQKAIQGDVQFAKMVLQLLGLAPEPPLPEMEISEADLALLQKAMEHHKGKTKPEQGND